MPEKQEKALRKVAKSLAGRGKLKKEPGESEQEAEDRFVFGVLRKRGWKPKGE